MKLFSRKRDRGVQEEQFRRYVQRELPRQLGLAPGATADAVIGSFGVGRSAFVRHVEVPGHGTVVLRAYARRRKLRALAGYRQLYPKLVSVNIPAPELLFIDDSPATRRTYGFAVLGEEFIAGRLFEDLPQATKNELLEPAADMLARLHGLRANAAGKPWEDERWSPRAYARDEAAKRLKRIEPLLRELDRGRRRRLAAWMGDQVNAAGRMVFPLVHHDVDKTNVLLGDDGRLRLLDFGRCGHWFPQYDLIVSEASLCWSHPERIDILRERYFAAPGAAEALSRDQYEATRPLWAACYHLRCAASRARRVERGNLDAADEARTQWTAATENLRAAGAPSSLLPDATL